MSKRNIEKHILMTKAEAQDLQKKAKRACLSEGGLIRLVLKGYEPREKPDERFYDVMRELSSIGNNINQLAAKANTLGFVDAPQLKKEAERWHKFQADVATDSYTLNWNTKTITITAYPETKAESRLINKFIEESDTKFKRVIQPA